MQVTLSDTARIILSRASQRDDLLVETPKLPPAAAATVVKSLLKKGLIEETEVALNIPNLALAAHGIGFAVTKAGLAAIGIEDEEPAQEPAKEPVAEQPAPAAAPEQEQEPVAEAPTGAHEGEEHGDGGEPQPVAEEAPTPRGNRLRDAAAAFLAAWDACPSQDATDNPISRAVADLRAAMAPKPARAPAGERKPREGTKREQVIDLLKRPEGATVDAIMDATGWQSHSVRGFFAALKKEGFAVATTEVARPTGDERRGKMLVYRI